MNLMYGDAIQFREISQKYIYINEAKKSFIIRGMPPNLNATFNRARPVQWEVQDRDDLEPAWSCPQSLPGAMPSQCSHLSLRS